MTADDLPANKPLSPLTRLRRRVGRILRELKRLYPEAETPLTHANPLQLLLATILSAQCTDERVNRVTPRLFARYPDAVSLANANPDEVEGIIHSLGFFHAKARNLIACCGRIVDEFGGVVPATMEALVTLPGVGRKTANVLLGNAFDLPGLPVDTHVARLSQRLGFTTEVAPERIERDLHLLVPKREWTGFSLRLIFHGRQVCHARKPRCEDCTLARLCPKVGVR
jgi:endonuclease-3